MSSQQATNPESPPSDDDAIAARVEAELDAETHDELCACPAFPGACVTYGDRIPWSHSDVDRIVKATLRAVREA